VGRATDQRDGAGGVRAGAPGDDDLRGAQRPSAAEILGRTQGSVAWFAFYTLFVAAVAVHAPIGLRTIIGEMCNWRGRGLDVLTGIIGLSLAMWGMRAVIAVFGGGA
jgi:fumarate reductase subunit C